MSKAKESPELAWAKNYHIPEQPLRMLGYFAKFTGKTPQQLLALNVKQRKTLLKKWILSLEGRRKTKITYLSTVRAFFDFHEKPVSMERMWVKTQIKSDRPKVEGNVTPEVFDTILKSVQGDPRKLSMFLVQLQSFSGPRELCIIGNRMGVKIGDSIKNGANLIELHFEEGRKHSENPWYSYLGKDACDSLRKWFQVRGYPTPDDPYIWPSLKATSKGAALTEHGVRQLFARITGRLGYTPKTTNRRTGQASWSRYGYSIKELRDLAISLAQRAVGKQNDQGEAFLESSTEYFAGHNLDPLQYRKLHKLDADFRKRQYNLVEPFLDVISNPPAAAVSTEAQKRIEEVEIKNKLLEERLAKLESISVERLTLVGSKKQVSPGAAVRDHGGRKGHRL